MSSKLNLEINEKEKTDRERLKTYLRVFPGSIFSMRPAASILSMIFCFDLACRTRLAYVPADAMNLGIKN